MSVSVRVIGIGALWPLISVAAPESHIEVDVNVVTALDVSLSVGPHEESIEREGLARALVHPAFLEAVRTKFHGRIGFAVATWSSKGNAKVLVPWTVIAESDDAASISQSLLSSDLIEVGQLRDSTVPIDHYEASAGEHQTDIALAISTASAILQEAPFDSPRSVINIVGNGPSNSGIEPTTARAAALDAGQVVNALVVGNASAADVAYYRTHVVGGPGSFVMQVSDPQKMTDAFLAKLRLDVAGLSEGILSGEQFCADSSTVSGPNP